MGYRHKMKRINLNFEAGHDLHGLEVSLRGLSLGNFLELQGMGEVDRSSLAGQLRRFAESLIVWNLEDEDTGEPIPATREAVFEQDQDLMLQLATAWLDALAGVPAPLDETSPDGKPSLVESIPMESLPQSLVS